MTPHSLHDPRLARRSVPGHQLSGRRRRRSEINRPEQTRLICGRSTGRTAMKHVPRWDIPRHRRRLVVFRPVVIPTGSHSLILEPSDHLDHLSNCPESHSAGHCHGGRFHDPGHHVQHLFVRDTFHTRRRTKPSTTLATPPANLSRSRLNQPMTAAMAALTSLPLKRRSVDILNDDQSIRPESSKVLVAHSSTRKEAS